MKKWALWLLFLCCPIIAFADYTGALNFTPPPGDVSVGFLADMFGVVDGVLDGNSTQIIGKMFAVFNSAVLALAGLLVAYTLVVSTMNTAHEGEVLGKQWSSIWIPVRSSIGLALLLPKSTGYCAAQVFVMWIVVQGVGAADKIWDTALDYLGSGGVIIAQSSDTSSTTSDDYNSVTKTAAGILSGQVCMLAMEAQLKALKAYSAPDSTSSGGGKCDNVNYNISNNSDSDAYLYSFCNYDVPDFINSVDFSEPLSDTSNKRSYVQMPSFALTSVTPSCSNSTDCTPPSDASYFYSKLNGMCGVVSWALLSDDNVPSDEVDSANDSIKVSVGELYQSLLTTSESIIDDSLFGNINATASTEYQSFGFPRTNGDEQCSPNDNASVDSCTGDSSSSCDSDYSNSDACLTWGGISGGGALFSGTELSGAVNTFVGLVDPLLRSMSLEENDASGDFDQLVSFIDSAKSQGWIMAGAYIFNLIAVNDQMSQVETSSQIADLALASANACDSNAYGKNAANNFGSSKTYSTSGITCGSTTGPLGTIISTLADNQMTISDFMGSVSYMVATKTDASVSGDDNPFVQLPGLDPNDSTFEKRFQTTTSVEPDKEYSSSLATYNMCTGTPYKDMIFIGSGSGSTQSKWLTSSTCVGQPLTNTTYAFALNSNALYVPQTNTNSANVTFSLTTPGGYNLSDLIPPPPDLDYKGVNVKKTSRGGGIFGIAKSVVNWFTDWVAGIWKDLVNLLISAVSSLIYAMVAYPLYMLTYIFIAALDQMTNTALNPITSLAAMGSAFINGTANLWYAMVLVCAVVSVFGGTMITAVVLMISPIFFVWLGIMFSIGCICAFYLPFLPYLVFTFASIGWFIGVIEAMVAAPIVALGVATPEGHQALGKATQAVMIILNVFLRPGLMILGFIFGFSLSYIGMWLVNAGFTRVYYNLLVMIENSGTSLQDDSQLNELVFIQFSTIFTYFFGVVIYVTMIIQVVTKSYDLIYALPDKITRWLSGGQQEGVGSETGAMAKDVKDQSQQTGSAVKGGLEESSTVAGKKLGVDKSGGSSGT